MNNQSEFLQKLKERLTTNSEWWRDTDNDPHGISVAVYVALAEVAKAIEEASAEKPITRDTPGKRDWPSGVL